MLGRHLFLILGGRRAPRTIFAEEKNMNMPTRTAFALFATLGLAIGSRAQTTTSIAPTAPPTSASSAASGITTPPSSVQNPLFGSVPTGKVTAKVLPLSLSDAIDRGLSQNLGLLLNDDAILAAQGKGRQELSNLLPQLSAKVSENAAEVNLAAQGFEKISARFPGFPLIVGPFGYFDVRAFGSQSLIDLESLDKKRSADQATAATRHDYQDTREAVVLVVAATYLGAVAARSQVNTAEAQERTAQVLYDQAVDLQKVGISAGIDLLRAQVELQTRQQQLIAAQNDFAKQKLALARTIGLPLGQPFTLTDTAPYEPPPTVSIEQALELAYANRADYQSALALARAAEYSRRAATAEHLPTVTANADYGVIGPTPDQTHGTFTASASLHIPIFAGGKAQGDALQAQAQLDRDRQQLDNLRGQIEQDVRNGLLDLRSASDQVKVARSNVDLAQQTLQQARDRFSSGVTDNIEVVQAQETVARANESYISSLYAYNLARVELARATGSAERSIRQYWKGK
jgi:outer membrane protein TolC